MPFPSRRLSFTQAIAWFRARLPLTPAQWRLLSAAARRQAFTVAGVSRLQIVVAVWQAIDTAVAGGQALEEFQEAVAAKLQREWRGTVLQPATRLETIYRTNLQQAFGAGRHAQQTDPDVLGARPYWMFDAVLDENTSRLCASLAGIILPAEHGFWQTHYPPNHFNCRSAVRSLTAAAAERRGGVTKHVPDEALPQGFDRVPAPGDWQPDLSDYPPEVVEAYQTALGGAR